MAQILARIRWFIFRHEVTRGTDPGEVAASGAGSTTTTVMATMTGADDEWNGYWLGCKTATNPANEGEARKITGFVSASGIFTHGAFPAATATGDTFEVFAFCPGTMEVPKYAFERLARDDYQRATFDPPASAIGKSISEMTANLEAWGIDQIGTEQDSLHHLLTGGLGPQLAAPSTSAVVAGSTTTELRITDTHGANFAVGQVVAVEDITTGVDEARRITAIDSTPVGYDALTVTPAFSLAPTASKAVKGSATYVPAETGHRSYTVVVQMHDQRWKFSGCDIRVSGLAEWVAGQLPMLGVEIKGDSRIDPVAASSVFGPQNPPSKTGPALLAGVVMDGATEQSCTSMSVDFGWEVSDQLAWAGRVQHRVTDRKTTGKVVTWNDAITVPAGLDADPTVALLMYGGSISGGMVGFDAPNAKVADFDLPDTDGMGQHDRSLEFFDPATDAGDSTKPVFWRL